MRTGGHKPSPGARAGDVAEETFAAEDLADAAAKRKAAPFQFVAVGLAEQVARRRRGRKDRFVQAEDYGELEIGIARAVHRADQDLVQRGRDDADRHPRQAGFQDDQPFRQRQRLPRERQRDVIEPGVHLLPDRGVELGMGKRAGRSVLKFGKGILDFQRAPQFAQCGGQSRAVGAKLAFDGKVFLEPQKRSGPLPAQTLRVMRFAVFVRKCIGPGLAGPALGQGLVFQVVNGLFVAGDQAGLEGAEPVVVPPVEGCQSYGVARQLRQRMVRGRLAAIQEERNPVPRKNAPQYVVVAFHRAQQNSGLAKASARMDKLENLAGGEHGFGFGIGANGGAQGCRQPGAGLGFGRDQFQESLLMNPHGNLLSPTLPSTIVWRGGRRGRRRGLSCARIGEGRGLRPVCFEVAEDRILREAAGVGAACEDFGFQEETRHGGEFLPAILPGLGDVGPNGKPGVRAGGLLGIHAKGESHLLTAGCEGGEQAQFLRSQFAEPIEPEGRDRDWGLGIGDCGLRIADCGFLNSPDSESGCSLCLFLFKSFHSLSCRLAQGGGSEIKQAIGVLKFFFREPVKITALKEGEIAELAAQWLGEFRARAEFCQQFGREFAPLQFAQFQAELAGKPRHAGAPVEDLKGGAVPCQQGAEHHDSSFFGEQRRPGPAQLFEHISREALEGENLQARVAGQVGVAKELAFQLESGLLGSEENEGRPLRVVAERGANFRQAPESFPGAGRTEEESRSHIPLVAQNPVAEKENQEVGWRSGVAGWWAAILKSHGSTPASLLQLSTIITILSLLTPTLAFFERSAFPSGPSDHAMTMPRASKESRASDDCPGKEARRVSPFKPCALESCSETLASR